MSTNRTAERPLALVTGASSGIGRELARLLARDGHDLVLVARDAAALQALADELTPLARCHVRPADLSDPAAPARLVAQLEADGLHPEILVNNAGVGTTGRFSALDGTQVATMLQINIAALTHLTRLLLPGMIARRRGRILNLASLAAFNPVPYFAAYAASKAYVLSFSEALAHELRGSGVTVTALCPGPTATRMGPAQAGGMTMDAATVARLGLRALHRGRRVRVTGAASRLLALLPQVLPRRVVARMAARAMASRA